MTENTPYNDPLDQYLLGKLPAEEMAAMDAKIAADSQLQEEMFLQRDIVNALQEERRLELKNRLNNIEVGAGGISSAVGLKLAAGVAMLGLVGTSLFLYFGEGKASEEQHPFPSGIIELSQHDPLIDYAVPEKPEANSISETTPALTTLAPAPVATQDRAPVRSNSTQIATTATQRNVAETTEARVEPAKPQAQVQKPKVLSEFKETDYSSNALQIETPVDAMARNQQFSTQTIDVSARSHDKWDFHYSFFESKLFIYGNFDNKPYEILEINTEGTTSYYLYFENSYYALKRDQQKVTKLRKLSNEKLIKELDITRNQKLNP